MVHAARLGVREHAVAALQQLAHGHPDNQIAIGIAGGISPLVGMIQLKEESPIELATAAIESLADECPENQIGLASAGAIPSLVELLNRPRETEVTRALALSSLLSLSKPPTREGRDAVVGALVGALSTAGRVGTLKVAEALACLVVRSTAERRNTTAESSRVLTACHSPLWSIKTGTVSMTKVKTSGQNVTRSGVGWWPRNPIRWVIRSSTRSRQICLCRQFSRRLPAIQCPNLRKNSA